MAELGRALLILSLLTALYGIAASLWGVRLGATGRGAAWADSGRRAMWAIAGFLTLAFAVLETAFLRSDFSLQVVATHSSLATPTFYKASAAWSSQEGSLLLWVWLLSVWASLSLFALRKRLRDMAPIATAILLGFVVFFCSL